VSGWEGDGPTYETVPIKKVQTYVSSAVRGIFESPEDMELEMKGEMTALQRKLQGTFTPREDGGFFTSGNVSHSYNYKDEIGMMYNGSVTISWSVQCGDLPKSDSPQITLSGCAELVVGEQAEVTAKAAAESGSIRFWVEPEEMFTIETTGATAKLMGSSPGRGKLFVEHTSANTEGGHGTNFHESGWDSLKDSASAEVPLGKVTSLINGLFQIFPLEREFVPGVSLYGDGNLIVFNLDRPDFWLPVTMKEIADMYLEYCTLKKEKFLLPYLRKELDQKNGLFQNDRS